jgi:hypothetical protein
MTKNDLIQLDGDESQCLESGARLPSLLTGLALLPLVCSTVSGLGEGHGSVPCRLAHRRLAVMPRWPGEEEEAASELDVVVDSMDEIREDDRFTPLLRCQVEKLRSVLVRRAFVVQTGPCLLLRCFDADTSS